MIVQRGLRELQPFGVTGAKRATRWQVGVNEGSRTDLSGAELGRRCIVLADSALVCRLSETRAGGLTIERLNLEIPLYRRDKAIIASAYPAAPRRHLA